MLKVRQTVSADLLTSLSALLEQYPLEPVQLQVIMRMGKTAIALRYCLDQYMSFAVVTREDTGKYQKIIPPERQDQVLFYVSAKDVDFSRVECVVFDDITTEQKVPAGKQAIYLCALRLSFIPESHVVKFTYQDYVRAGCGPLVRSMVEKTMPTILKKIESLNPHDNPILIICEKKKFENMKFDPKYKPMFSNEYNAVVRAKKNAVVGTSELLRNVSLPQFQFVIIAKPLEEDDLIQAAFRANTWTPWKKESFVFCINPEWKKKIDNFLVL